MKIASIILNALGILINLGVGIAYIELGYEELLATGVIALIGVPINIIAIILAANNKKSVVFGVFDIIFGSQLGGIFYLCWRPNGQQGRPAQTSNRNVVEPVTHVDRRMNNPNVIVDDSAQIELVRKYKKLLDEGLITQEEYEQKRRDLLDL